MEALDCAAQRDRHPWPILLRPIAAPFGLIARRVGHLHGDQRVAVDIGIGCVPKILDPFNRIKVYSPKMGRAPLRDRDWKAQC